MRAKEPKLFGLDPKSVIRIHLLIRKYVAFHSINLKTKKDLSSLFNNNYDLSLEEKYFIASYLPQYLNLKDKNSYVSMRIKESEDLGDYEDIDKMIEHAIGINEVCNLNLKKYKRRYNSSIKSNINFIKIDEILIPKIKDWKRLPVEDVFRVKFIEIINKELSPYYSDETIKAIIDNSFRINAFRGNIKLLNIEFERSSDIYRAFRNIYKEYKKNSHSLKYFSKLNDEIFNGHYIEPKENEEDSLTEAENEIKEIKKERKELREKFKLKKNKDEYYKATNRINFAKILFLSFSKIRENFINNQATRNESDLENYLENVSKNIKK